MKKLTRRTLISLAALLPVIQVEAASSERFDVIVVGAGIAGLAAAVSAAESGAKRVLVLEKGPMIGGHAIYADGTVSAVYPRLQKVFNIKDSPEQMAKQIWEWGDRDGDLSLIRVMARHSGPAIDWLRGMGVHFRDWVFVPYPSNFPRGLTSHPTRGGYEYIRALKGRARALRVEVRLNTRVVQLLRSGGAVTGVSASGPKGVERFYAASVVLATGGFSANPDMIRRYSHLKNPGTHSSANPGGRHFDGATVFSLEPRSARLSLKCPISNSFHFGAAGCSNTWAAIFS
ncbi:MAG: FAD-dependent oxidoreductase [Dakarella massiliensis]